MGFGVENAGGLLGLLALVPFIIVYLIKPKPVKMPVPSIVFFMKRAKATTKESFLRVFQKDYLFFIQLLVLLLIIFSMAYPYFARQQDVVSKNLVFVIDVSASSQVLEGDKTRFEIAKGEIKKLAADSNTVVFAKSSPIIALQNAGKSELNVFLNRIQPTEDESRIGDAMLVAAETLASGKGRIIVASDFINTRGVSVKTATDILKGKDISVDLINTALRTHKNIGITDVIADEESTTVYIRNFNNEQENVFLDVDGVSESFFVDANNMEPFIYKTKLGVSKLEIKNKDDFMADNIAYVSNPFGKKINVVYIANNPSKFLVAALNSSSRINLIKAEPPVIPKDEADVYIIGQIDIAKVLPGTFEDISKKVAKGTALVLTAYDGINKADFKGLSNVEFDDAGLVKTDSIEVNKITRFTRDADFGVVKRAYSLQDVKGDILAESNGTALFVYNEFGKGKAVYYGILEKESSFQLSPTYPVFWVNLVKFLVDAREMQELNLKTGMSFIDDKNNEVVMDMAGFYNVSGNEVAVNLANEKESDVNPGEEYGSKANTFKFSQITEEVRDSLLDYLLIIVLMLIAFEIYYVKRRGTL